MTYTVPVIVFLIAKNLYVTLFEERNIINFYNNIMYYSECMKLVILEWRQFILTITNLSG